MVFYYEQNEPIYYALFVFARTKTIFGMVTKRFEFWFFLLAHLAGVVLFAMGFLSAGEFDNFRWEAVSATQMFMVFLLTFFNGHCFARFLELYDHCMDVLDGTLFFVQELVVSFAPPKVENHKIRAVKYVLAMMHVFFVGITGGMKSKGDWREIVKRGLLTKLEAQQLQSYPAHSHETVLVLATWTMQIVDKGLEEDVFWDFRSMRIAHTHNRLQYHMTSILRSIHEVGDVLALPIPYPYYHVMNLVLLFNLLILCIICSSLGTYQTVFPFVVTLLFFLGLREVSASLADPFKGEDSDFPIDTFLQYAFDTSVCLLESFRNGNAEEFVSRLLDTACEFTDEQLRRAIPDSVLYTKNYDPSVSSPFSWNKEMPLLSMSTQHQGPLHVMRANSMAPSKESSEATKKSKEVERIDLGAGKRDVEEASASLTELVTRCVNFCCPRRHKFNVDKAEMAPQEVRHAQATLAEAETKTVTLKQDIAEWRLRLETQQSMLEHRVKVGNDLGLPIDRLLGRGPPEVEAHPKPKLEFSTFSEAALLIKQRQGRMPEPA